MAEALIEEFEGVTIDDYHKANRALGLDPATGAGDWPAGLLSHTAAMADNTAIVIEVWDSQASHATFMAERLGPALAQVGLPAPSRVAWFSVVGEWRA
jgi:hypothetical protein